MTVVVDEAPRTAHAALAARFDPLVGHLVWTGQVSTALPPRTSMVIRTRTAVVPAEAMEQDPWGNTRIRGYGRPPFPVPLVDALETPAGR